MSASSDISSLFKLFGGRADQYQQISQEGSETASQRRWPALSGGELEGTALGFELVSPGLRP